MRCVCEQIVNSFQGGLTLRNVCVIMTLRKTHTPQPRATAHLKMKGNTTMKDFTTITELELLRYACFTILEQWCNASDALKKRPNNRLTQARFEKADARYNELHARILELEQAEQN